jgi:hypothetical protein
MKAHVMGALCAGLFSLGLISPANATLFGVLPATPMGTDWLAYYDNQLNITWSANADGNSARPWLTQEAWAAGITIGSVSGWRLPSADVNGDNGVIDCFTGGAPGSGGASGCEDNEMGFLYWEEGISAATPGPFSNVQFGTSWSSTDFVSDTNQAWLFGFGNGLQDPFGKSGSALAWAVHDGNPGGAVVPVPASVWLFGSALGLLGRLRRRRATE